MEFIYFYLIVAALTAAWIYEDDLFMAIVLGLAWPYLLAKHV